MLREARSDVVPVLDPPTALAFATLFAVVVALAWRRPLAGPLALLLAIPFDAPHWIGATTLTTPKVVLVAALAATIARRLDVTVLATRPARLLLAASLALVAATLLSALGADDRGEVLRQTLKAVEYAAAFLVAAIAYDHDRDEGAVRVTLAALTLLVSLAAVWQLAVGTIASVAQAATLLLPRLAGPLEGPNQLAGYLGVTLALPLASIARGRAMPLERVAVAGGTAVLLLTLSRAGILAAVAAAGVVIVLGSAAGARGRGTRRIAVATLAGGLLLGVGCLGAVAVSKGGAAAAMSAMSARLSEGEPAHTGGVGHRSELWRAAWTLWLRHPVLGVGAGNFEEELGSVGLAGVRTHANSLYLQSLVEGGLPLLAATLFTVWASIVPLSARARRTSPLVLAAAAGSLALALHQFVDLMTFYPKVGETWWVVLGLGAAAAEVGRK